MSEVEGRWDEKPPSAQTGGLQPFGQQIADIGKSKPIDPTVNATVAYCVAASTCDAIDALRAARNGVVLEGEVKDLIADGRD